MDPGAAAREAAHAGDYGAVIRLARQARHLTLEQLGDQSAYSHSALSRLERRGPSGSYDVATLQRLSDILGIPPTLLGLAGTPITHAARAQPLPAEFPDGRVFSANLPNAQTRPARRRASSVVIEVEQPDSVPRRGILVGVTDDGTAVAMDLRHARRRLERSTPGAPLVVPVAYTLDDLTAGVAWAVANFDEPLLTDDARLDGWHRRLTGSAADSDPATDLHPVSRMWLGSDYCARHIVNHMGQLHEVPAFWTQERRGEEASAWLLFAHKLAYLNRIATRYEGAATFRAFCVPSETVAASTRCERLLFMLAAALIESFGIDVVVCVEPGYTAVEGCVLDGERQAIVASWVGVDALWHVDVTDTRPTVREFSDAIGYARHHSVVSAQTPPERLHALADYLDVDWRWLTARCLEFGDYGAAGLAEPSSRLLSVAGVDRASRFLGDLGRT